MKNILKERLLQLTFRFPLTVLLMLTLNLACSQAQKKKPVKKHEVQKGFGFRDNEKFEGIPFKLPEGIELREPIRGYNAFQVDSCQGISWEKMKGEGVMVGLCIGFKNNTGGPINVTLPPGLIIISDSDKTQHGIIAEEGSLEVPSDQYMVSLNKDYFMAMGAYCINVGRPGGGNTEFKYKFGPVTTHKPLLDFFKLLAKKEKRTPNGAPDPKISAIVQVCIFCIISKGELDAYSKEQFAKIPDKK